jgi:type IV pilus assembly protein PilA
MPTCPRCSTALVDGVTFCSACGANLQALVTPTSPVTSAVYGSEPKTSGKAIASLVCGFFFFLFPIPVAAIILGHLSHSEIRKSGGRLKGQGMAVAGLVLGYLGVLFIPIWLIIAAIAIPNLMRSRIAANEASTVGTLRTYNVALSAYASQCPSQGYPASVANLGPGRGDCGRANLVDVQMSAPLPRKSGYLFFYAAGKTNRAGQVIKYTINADPISPNTTGIRHFFLDESGIIRVGMDAPATPNSPPLT